MAHVFADQQGATHRWDDGWEDDGYGLGFVPYPTIQIFMDGMGFWLYGL